MAHNSKIRDLKREAKDVKDNYLSRHDLYDASSTQNYNLKDFNHCISMNPLEDKCQDPNSKYITEKLGDLLEEWLIE